MEQNTTPAKTSAAARRPWIVLLYFYLAALVGFGFFITGVTTGLFGAKDLTFPQLGLSSYSYDSMLHRDSAGNVTATPQERQEAKDRALDDRRHQGADSLIDGVILAAVGLPTMVWHLRKGRRVGAEQLT
ncbi:MAG TPA: hypothetical protein VFE65_04775 [Pseudonocardia sp.]|nr:hypothetical protein [Pseudonocardia sp.]